MPCPESGRGIGIAISRLTSCSSVPSPRLTCSSSSGSVLIAICSISISVPGGWRLTGHYPFSSGCDYAQWAIIGASLGEKGDPRSITFLLVPLAEVEIVDDWQVLGLLGTGSKSLILHDVFVPEHRSVMVSDLFAGTPRVP